ncbi:Transposase [Cordylochernes scorpioides]|uniref:Transposase n=1 Tax=Cordylochernes scorpioides TaxID=51811 RepID=A0ABY6KVW7_9ARAC|nr:Transposase [Cordylochernes scorpioides]
MSISPNIYLIPAHVGIEGNEQADDLAKEGRKQTLETSSITLKDANIIAKLITKTKIPQPICNLNINRELTTTISRIRTGHFKGMKKNPDMTRSYRNCNNCHNTQLTPDHIYPVILQPSIWQTSIQKRTSIQTRHLGWPSERVKSGEKGGWPRKSCPKSRSFPIGNTLFVSRCVALGKDVFLPQARNILANFDIQLAKKIRHAWIDVFFDKQWRTHMPLVTLLCKNVQDTLDHSISTRTISCRLVANGLSPGEKTAIDPTEYTPRLEWCRAKSTWMTEWHRVVDSRRVRVWRRRGESSNPTAFVERSNMQQRGIMVWGAIAYDTRSPLVRIQGTMAAQRYDNARRHTARIRQQALQDVHMLPWPLYSPDLSPIYHVWDIIGRRLHALPQPRSEDELWQMVEREWRAIPQDAICSLIDSLPRRVAACIAVRGGEHTLSSRFGAVVLLVAKLPTGIASLLGLALVLLLSSIFSRVLGTFVFTVADFSAVVADGRKSIADDSRSGRPLTSKTDRNIGQVRDLIVADRKITIDNIYVRVNVDSIQELTSITALSTTTSTTTGRLGTFKLAVAFFPAVEATIASDFLLSIIRIEVAWPAFIALKFKDTSASKSFYLSRRFDKNILSSSGANKN